MSSFVFSEKPIEMVSGDGMYLTASDGTNYLDFGASYACVPVGHSHPAVVDAVTSQAQDLTYVQASYPHAARTALYEQLAEVAPGDVDNVWLCNSGTEANEAALKFARSATGRSKIIATTRGFHGRTMGSLATTWKDKYKKPYEPLIDGVEFVPYGDSEAIADAIDDETAAVILEPLQGEGGINPPSTEFLRTARVHTAQHGAALVMDEIQTGLGRTGSMWATETHNVVPDVLTSAKGIASGLPLGATLVRDWVADGAASHGSTFSGNPIVCAAAGATLDVIESESLADHAAETGQYLRGELERRLGDDVRDVRGEGLMVGVEVKRGANRLLRARARNPQHLARPAARPGVRRRPPRVAEEEHCDAVVDALAEVVR
jgi:acetylornithine/LysW-gamma-L-lysine aminotransferase